MRADQLSWCVACGDTGCLTHCVWCWVDCTTSTPIHLTFCPQATGLFPASGEVCCDCDRPVGAVYARLPETDPDTFRVVCLPCAAATRTEDR